MVPRLLKITYLAYIIALLDSTALESVLIATTPCCHHPPPALTSGARPVPNTCSFSLYKDDEEPGSNSHSSPFCVLSLTTQTLSLPTPLYLQLYLPPAGTQNVRVGNYLPHRLVQAPPAACGKTEAQEHTEEAEALEVIFPPSAETFFLQSIPNKFYT